MKLPISDQMAPYEAALAPYEWASSATGTHHTKLSLLMLSVAAAILAGNAVRLSGQVPAIIDREPEIKAAYLYNFGRYVEWPPGSIGPNEFVIGVVGNSPVVAPLSTIAASKKINGRTITVLKFQAEKDFKPCHLLFIPTGQDPKVVAAILKASANTPTLFVGEDKDFATKHGHLGFYSAQNNVKFEINHKSAANAGLKISSKLLSLGRIVGEKPGK